MRNAISFGVLAFGIAVGAMGQPAGEPKLTATVALEAGVQHALTVGDRAVVTIELTVPSAGATGEPRFPSWGKTWGDAEIVRAEPVEKVANGAGLTTFRQRVTMVAFHPGKVPLPPVDVIVPEKAGSRALKTPADLALTLTSVISGDPKQAKPEPPAAPRPLPWGRNFWWTFAAMSALALALGAWLFVRHRATAAERAALSLPPLEELERELTRISAGLDSLGDGLAPARIAAALSSALRRFLGRELVFPALESTTTEIQRRLRSGQTPENLSRPGVDLLRRLDRIKFSRREAESVDKTATGATFDSIFTEGIATARSVATGLDRHLHPEPLPEATEASAPTRRSAAR